MASCDIDIGKVPDKEYSMPSNSSLHSIIGFKFLMSNIFTTSKVPKPKQSLCAKSYLLPLDFHHDHVDNCDRTQKL